MTVPLMLCPVLSFRDDVFLRVVHATLRLTLTKPPLGIVNGDCDFYCIAKNALDPPRWGRGHVAKGLQFEQGAQVLSPFFCAQSCPYDVCLKMISALLGSF